MNELEVITLTKHSLKKALLINKYWNGSYDPPFSKNKAKWMLENKRAEEEDVLAILGYENYKISALVYLVPDLVKDKNGISKKIFWSQRWWVADVYKETVLSAYVKQISLNACNNQVMIKFLGDTTKAYYEKQPFRKLSKRNRHIILFSLDYGLIVNKKSILKKITPLLKLVDNISRIIIVKINNRKKVNATITFEKVDKINNTIWNFVEKHCIEDIVPKSKSYINWQISNNQYCVLNSMGNNLQDKCLLNSIALKIYNINLVIKNKNNIIGFISAHISGNRFVIRYFLSIEDFYNDCVDIMIKNLINSKCTILQTENDRLGELVNRRYFNIYNDVKELVSLSHNSIELNFENLAVKDQDGNML